MAFVKKVWKSRISEYPNRRILTDSESVQTRVTVQRDEGVVSQEGDGFTKANMDNLEKRIGDAFDAEHTFLTGILTANATQIDFTDESIEDGCMPHVYVPMEKSKLIYDSMQIVNTHTLRLTFPAQNTDTTIKVKIEKDQTPVV